MQRKYSLDVVVVVLLFGIYAICAVLLCMIGANVYHNTADSMARNYDNRTGALYVVEKIRQNDSAGVIATDSVEGSDALVITEKKSGQGYRIWLFVKDGTLYEGFFAPDTEPDPALCEEIMPMQSLTITMTGSRDKVIDLAFTTTDGKTQDFSLSLRSAGSGGAR
ncbi:MAG TPA: hypothetical protein DEB24_03355 [Coriobacteriia bacterium]|nr:hypothetical protein [Coriobacteriia bacterium]